MADKICAYDGCNEPVNSPHDNEYCVFHAPKDKKGITGEEFNKLIFKKLDRKDYNFRGYVFPIASNFGNRRFEESADFACCEFNGDVNFAYAIFEDSVDFTNLAFKGKALFTSSKFHDIVSFSNVKFEDLADFENSVFKNYAYFQKCKFKNKAIFDKAIFENIATFEEANFENNASFVLTQFNNHTVFHDIKIYREMEFRYIYIGDKCGFDFHNPKFLSNNILINFDNVRFNPFASYFGNIKFDIKDKPFFIFRYCQLKDVFFTNNDMSLFSFYKSSYDEARLISCKWGKTNDRILIFPYKRKNIIPEESLLKELAKNITDEHQAAQFRDKYHINDLKNYKDISPLYRQMKTALDNSKDYQQAGLFYFNELEMKRRALEDDIENSKPKRKIFQRQPAKWFYQQFRKIFSKYIFYYLYKVFTGYGEKPLWSSIWFVVYIAVFTILNFCIGIKIGTKQEDEIIKYSDATIWDSLIFTLYRIIPTNYLPFKYTFDVPHNFWGLLIPFLNTAVLIIMFAFIVIGLKRHFRRF
ncbi:MAG: pentapeptide repeat-containing protein [candidate division Zixibacteria bacterium]|nr:pentapeptide repeat-containing protein [candidate division Zixibacteria bacterium]